MMWTINAIADDGFTYAVYFECDDIIDAEYLVKQVGLKPDDAGICEFVGEYIHLDDKQMKDLARRVKGGHTFG